MVNLWSHMIRNAGRTLCGVRLVVLLPICALTLVVGSAPAASFTASLNPNVVTLGESTTLALTFTGGEPASVPSVPAVAGLEFSYTGRSSQINIVNSSVTSTVTESYSVTPRRAGTFIIPEILVSVAGQRLSSQPIRLTVLKPGAPPPAAIQSGAELAFLRLLLPRKDIYLGQIIVAQLELYLRSDVRSVDAFQVTGLPADGFTVGKQVQGPQRRAQIGNAIYNVVPFRFTLKAVKTGSFKIGPVTATVIVRVPNPNRRGNPFFDDFSDPFGMFGGGLRKRLALATEPVEVNALALPADDVPPAFAGAVGSFTMTASAGPTNVAVGDPITVKVRISGRGAIEGLTLPDQPGWGKFKTYPPTSKVDVTDKLGLQGTKSFEEVVVPQSADIKQLPPFAFSFFDPDTKSYRTLRGLAVPLVVRPSGPAAAPSIAAAGGDAQQAPPPDHDIVYIKQTMGSLAQVAPPLLRQSWFIGLQTVPLLAWFMALAWRRRSERLANNPRLRRRREVAQRVRNGCVELRQLASAKDSDGFFATLFRLLQEQIGERLDVPASSITEGVVEEQLHPRNVSEDLLNRLRELFQMCNLARYAPIKSSQELAAIVPKLESVLSEIQQLTLEPKPNLVARPA